jgi:hypothetical protein
VTAMTALTPLDSKTHPVAAVTPYQSLARKTHPETAMTALKYGTLLARLTL